MKLIALIVLVICFCSHSSYAKVWRVNNNAGVSADFNQPGTAVLNSQVLAGDTLYIESSGANYNNFTLNKTLVLIGPGYFLSGANGNAGLQVNPNPATIIISIDSLGSGSTLMGLSGTVFVNSNVDNITITRCNISLLQNSVFANSRMTGLVVNKCYGGMSLSGFVLDEPRITNNIFTNFQVGPNCINALVRNNVFTNSPALVNSYVANNIFLNGGSFTNCVIKYNISVAPNVLPAADNNLNGIAAATLFETSTSTDGRYQLRAGSPAIGAGEPVNSVTPDIGAFGTADPYKLSGIPAIPTIYSLIVPASVPSTAVNMNVTFSTRSNN